MTILTITTSAVQCLVLSGESSSLPTWSPWPCPVSYGTARSHRIPQIFSGKLLPLLTLKLWKLLFAKIETDKVIKKLTCKKEIVLQMFLNIEML